MLIPCGSVFANEPIKPELKQVASELKSIVKKLDPKAEVTCPVADSSLSLMVTYRTQMYKVHGRQMTGEILPEAHDELGPSYQGFVLTVNLQDKGEVNQAVTPQTIREPYWLTDLDVTPLRGTNKQIYWALSYGSRTDSELLARIRQKLRDLK
jgi:hypothetical protein